MIALLIKRHMCLGTTFADLYVILEVVQGTTAAA